MAGHSKWANIKHRKGAQDAKRGKVFTLIYVPNAQKDFLFNNNIPELPESVGGLKRLVTVSVENNRLKRLPKSIGRCQEETQQQRQP